MRGDRRGRRSEPSLSGPGLSRRGRSGGRAGEPRWVFGPDPNGDARRGGGTGAADRSPYDATGRGGAPGDARSVGPKSSGSFRDTNGFSSTSRAMPTSGVRLGSALGSFIFSRSGSSVWVSASAESTRASSAFPLNRVVGTTSLATASPPTTGVIGPVGKPGDRSPIGFSLRSGSGAAETVTRSFAKRAAGDALVRETRGGGVVIPKKLTSGARRRGAEAGEESGGESAWDPPREVSEVSSRGV